jgi:HD-GYP domain-containing protein (c-di-GMP phosphodiesterase class II)
MISYDQATNMDRSQFTATLNSHIADVHSRIRQKIPAIDRISFALYDSKTKVLKTYADSTLAGEPLVHYEFPLENVPSLKACAECKTDRLVHQAESDLKKESGHSQWLARQGFNSSLASPTYYHDDLIGFIFINSKQVDVFDTETTHELYPYIDCIKAAASVEYELIHTIIDAANFLLEKNPRHLKQSQDHKERMFHYTQIITKGVAEVYQLNDEFIDNISQFSRFHDIGKLTLPPSLLTTPCKLAHIDKEKVTQHIDKGVDIIDKLIAQTDYPNHSCLTILREIVAYHHEYMDGTGYPFGLQSADIPISARIITVANIFDALTSHRPYKQAQSVLYALLDLEKMVQQGKLDRHCVNALRYEQQHLNQIIRQYPEMDPKDLDRL